MPIVCTVKVVGVSSAFGEDTSGSAGRHMAETRLVRKVAGRNGVPRWSTSTWFARNDCTSAEFPGFRFQAR